MSKTEAERLQTILEGIKQRLPDAVESEEHPYGDMMLNIKRERIHDVLAHLKRVGFEILMDIAGVDTMKLEGRKERFELVYNLFSIEKNLRVFLRVRVPEDDMTVPTATDLWEAANWGEREAYDMFGFHFEGHPNLVRILCHREFVGHALRKDYPIMKGQWATGTSDLTRDLERE
jgi:NADH-quinone oxidoreductase subunit C